MKHLLIFLNLPTLMAPLGFCMETAVTAPGGVFRIMQQDKDGVRKEEFPQTLIMEPKE